MSGEDRFKGRMELQVMQKLNEDRKLENFETLKAWDQARAFHLMVHRKIAEEIQESLQNRIAESDQFLNVVLQFLCDCEQQQKNYENQTVTNPENKFRVNPISQNIHVNTSQCLVRMYKMTQNFKPYKKIKALLQEVIQSIQTIQSQSEKEVMEIRTKLELAIVEIQNANEETSSKCDIVATNYRQKPNKLPVEADDLFVIQQRFLQEAQHQTQIQREYGNLTVEYIQIVSNYEKRKLELIKDTLQKYLKALAETREGHDGVASLVDILHKKTEGQYIDILYSCEELLGQQVIQDMKKVENRKQGEKISMENVKNFLRNLKYDKFDNRNLILKEYHPYLRQQEAQQGSDSNSEQPQNALENIILLISVDHYLHIYVSIEGEEVSITSERNTLPDLSINLLNSNNFELVREGDMGLRIGIKKSNNSNGLVRLLSLIPQKGYMNHILVIFMSEDQREEFIEFIERATSK